MSELKELDNVFSVCGQINEAGVATAVSLGFKTLVNNRPDGEVMTQPSSDEVALWAKKHGMKYYHLPIPTNDIPIDSVIKLGEIYESEAKPILAFCTTGMRSSALWSFMMVVMSDAEVDTILAQPTACGFDLATLKDPLLSVRKIMAAQAE